MGERRRGVRHLRQGSPGPTQLPLGRSHFGHRAGPACHGALTNQRSHAAPSGLCSIALFCSTDFMTDHRLLCRATHTYTHALTHSLAQSPTHTYTLATPAQVVVCLRFNKPFACLASSHRHSWQQQRAPLPHGAMHRAIKWLKVALLLLSLGSVVNGEPPP